MPKALGPGLSKVQCLHYKSKAQTWQNRRTQKEGNKRGRENRDERREKKGSTEMRKAREKNGHMRERGDNLWRKVNCHMLVAETIGPSA